MPAVAANGVTGTVRVMWYDRRNDVNNLNIDLYAANSTNGGASFSGHTRITLSSFGVPKTYPNFDCVNGNIYQQVAPCYMGDYNMIAAYTNDIGFEHAWGDNSLKFLDDDSQQMVPDPDVRVAPGC